MRRERSRPAEYSRRGEVIDSAVASDYSGAARTPTDYPARTLRDHLGLPRPAGMKPGNA